MPYTSERVQYLERELEGCRFLVRERDRQIEELREALYESWRAQKAMSDELEEIKAFVAEKVEQEAEMTRRAAHPPLTIVGATWRGRADDYWPNSVAINHEIASEIVTQAHEALTQRNKHPEALETTAIEANGPEIDESKGPGGA